MIRIEFNRQDDKRIKIDVAIEGKRQNVIAEALSFIEDHDSTVRDMIAQLPDSVRHGLLLALVANRTEGSDET